MKFWRKTAKYTIFDHRRNQDIMKELRTPPVLEKMNNHKHRWIHVRRMDGFRLVFIVMKYKPGGKSNPG
jgi:hypothetical protein